MALSTPDSEPRLFHGPGPGLRLILLVGLAVALMVLDHRNQHLAQIRSYLAAALYPLQQAVNAPFAASRWAEETLASRSDLIAQNSALREELLLKSGRLQRLAALEAENVRMRALLDSTPKVGDRALIAEILSVDTDRLRHRVILNRGSRDGAFVGQAIIDADGVVGQITRDRGTSAEALLITDPDHAVPCEVLRTGLRTIAVGTGDLEKLSLPFMARNSDVKAGDLLVTSGLGGMFPAGYPVGTVSEVRGDTGESFLTVTATPAAALDRVREVLLVIPRAGPVPAETTAPAQHGGGGQGETALPARTGQAPDAATGTAAPNETEAPAATGTVAPNEAAAPATAGTAAPNDTEAPAATGTAAPNEAAAPATAGTAEPDAAPTGVAPAGAPAQ